MSKQQQHAICIAALWHFADVAAFKKYNASALQTARQLPVPTRPARIVDRQRDQAVIAHAPRQQSPVAHLALDAPGTPMRRSLAFGQCILLLAHRRQSFQLLQRVDLHPLRGLMRGDRAIAPCLGRGQPLGIKGCRQSLQHGVQPGQRLPQPVGLLRPLRTDGLQGGGNGVPFLLLGTRFGRSILSTGITQD